jgi:hypothetical protein
MTTSGGRRYDLDQRQSASGSQLSALLTKSTLQSPPTPDSHRRPERAYDTAPDHSRPVQRTLPSPQLPPSAAMQIPQRPHRDSFNFTSPLQSTSHPDRSPHSHPNDSHPRHPTLTRHESFSYPYQSSSSASDNARPRPPPLRTAHSAYASRVQCLQSPTDESGMGLIEEEDGKRDGGGVDMEELTTKGRKRKRLAKACSACHVSHQGCMRGQECGVWAKVVGDSGARLRVRLTKIRRINGDATDSPLARTASSHPDHVYISTRWGRLYRLREHGMDLASLAVQVLLRSAPGRREGASR